MFLSWVGYIFIKYKEGGLHEKFKLTYYFVSIFLFS